MHKGRHFVVYKSYNTLNFHRFGLLQNPRHHIPTF